ncbi:MAG: hypothetical protein LH606_19945 [Cytophagaceae bacterium]|nr:hypothetical protein [Cytophagaceae bacterium]
MRLNHISIVSLIGWISLNVPRHEFFFKHNNTEYYQQSVLKISKPMKPLSQPRPDLNGIRVKHPGNAGIFLIIDGQRRLIPTWPTHQLLFRDSEVLSLIDIESIDLGQPLTEGAMLAKPKGSNATYLISNGIKRWISFKVLGLYRFKNYASVVEPVILNSIPDGAHIPEPTARGK